MMAQKKNLRKEEHREQNVTCFFSNNACSGWFAALTTEDQENVNAVLRYERTTLRLTSREIPQDAFASWTILKGLNLECPSLTALPTSLGQLQALTDMNLQECISLEFLPRSLGQLTVLNKLNLGGCSTIELLPESLVQLPTLTWLNLGCCKNSKRYLSPLASCRR